jgi:hypothetical protein
MHVTDLKSESIDLVGGRRYQELDVEVDAILNAEPHSHSERAWSIYASICARHLLCVAFVPPLHFTFTRPSCEDHHNLVSMYADGPCQDQPSHWQAEAIGDWSIWSTRLGDLGLLESKTLYLLAWVFDLVVLSFTFITTGFCKPQVLSTLRW